MSIGSERNDSRPATLDNHMGNFKEFMQNSMLPGQGQPPMGQGMSGPQAGKPQNLMQSPGGQQQVRLAQQIRQIATKMQSNQNNPDQSAKDSQQIQRLHAQLTKMQSQDVANKAVTQANSVINNGAMGR